MYLLPLLKGDGELACLVAKQHSRDLDDGHEDKVGTSVEDFLRKLFHSVNRIAIG
jgi:hypothetical protein